MIFQPIYILKEILGYHPAAENERVSKVNRKTWKSWHEKGFIPDNKTARKAKENYDTYFNQIVREFSERTDQANLTGLIDKLDNYFYSNSLSRGLTWRLLFNSPLEQKQKTSIWQYFSNTKKKILMLENKGTQIDLYLEKEHFEAAADLLFNFKLPGLHFTDKNIIAYIKKANTGYDFMTKGMLFLLRANLYCLASFDAEDTIRTNQEASQLNYLLPRLEEKKIYPPIFMWFEAIRKKVGSKESWEKLCLSDAFENYNEDNYL